MSFEVLLTADAVRDLEEIADCIAAHDSPVKAARVLDRIEAVIAGLAKFPERGAYPGELLALGMQEYRETFFDGRRDLQSLLARRLLGG
jgi:toxin ParE1/3/4